MAHLLERRTGGERGGHSGDEFLRFAADAGGQMLQPRAAVFRVLSGKGLLQCQRPQLHQFLRLRPFFSSGCSSILAYILQPTARSARVASF